jgi:hypothetical protein
MMPALGAAGSLVDALLFLTSSKSPSATASTGHSPGAANPFDPGSSMQTQGTTGFLGGAGAPSISPQSQSALIQAQSSGTDSNSTQASALVNMMDKIKLQPIDVSQLKITKLDTTNLLNTVSFDIRL